MRAFLIPHASPHNSHANRISRPRRQIKEWKSRVRKRVQRRDYYRRSTFAHNAGLVRRCFSHLGALRPQVCHNRIQHESELLFREVREHPRVPRCDRKKDPAPSPVRRNRVLARVCRANIGECCYTTDIAFLFYPSRGFSCVSHQSRIIRLYLVSRN